MMTFNVGKWHKIDLDTGEIVEHGADAHGTNRGAPLVVTEIDRKSGTVTISDTRAEQK
jgi:hypothetical protein